MALLEVDPEPLHHLVSVLFDTIVIEFQLLAIVKAAPSKRLNEVVLDPLLVSSASLGIIKGVHHMMMPRGVV